jgi:hypothetical protein
MVNDTYNDLRAAIAQVESSLGNLKSLLNMTTDDVGASAPEEEPAPADQFSTPALASSAPASVPTIEPVDEAEVPDAVKAADQGA